MARHFHEPRWPGDTRSNTDRRRSHLLSKTGRRSKDKTALAALSRLGRKSVKEATFASFDAMLKNHYQPAAVESLATLSALGFKKTTGPRWVVAPKTTVLDTDTPKR